MSEDNELKRVEQTSFDSVVAELSGVVASKSSSKKKKTPVSISKTTFIKEVKRVILSIVTSIMSAESQSKPSSAKSKSSKKGGLRNKHTRKTRH